MGIVSNILFPVDFSPSSIAMGPYVKRVAAIFSARVTLIHVFNPISYSGLEVYVRGPVEIAEDHRELARERLDAFLPHEFPPADYPRILESGDVAATITETARNGFDLIIMPTHAGVFRRMLLGSTVAKVLNDADCPVVTSRHAETIAPRPMEHRELLCSIGLSENSERVLRFAHRAAAESGAHLYILHAVQPVGRKLPVRLDLEEQVQSGERQLARERIAELQRKVGSQAKVCIAIGPVKEALLEAMRQFDADALFIGRSPHPGAQGRLRDLTYSMVRDSPFPVISV
jgi:nucleotide-binding universal stress UspA family protein